MRKEKERYEYFFGTNTVKDNKTSQFYGCTVDLLNQQDKRIKELEQENQQLKQQLANKDKELKQLKLDLGMFKSVNEFLNRYGIEKAREVLLQTEKTKRQDKISFAVEQLEKVKALLNTDFESIISWIDPYEDGECLTSMTYNHNNTIKIIDNQINELKGE